MQAEIITIGTELILGKTLNTNAAFLSQGLAALGIDLFYQTTVDDNKIRLFTVLKRAMHRSDIVIATGGLGPTVDDITLEVIAQATQSKLILNANVLQDIKRHFQKRHIPMLKANIRQALIPEKTKKIMRNELGTAVGLIIDYEKKTLITLPGVPQEMKAMVKRDVIPYLKRNSSAAEWAVVSRTIRTTGLAESQVNQKVKDILQSNPPLYVGIYAHTASVDLTVTAKVKNAYKRQANKKVYAVKQAQALIDRVERKIQRRLKTYIYAKGEQVLEEVVAWGLTKRSKTIAVAESCTGGLISKRLTNISGSSQYFPLGLVAYSNQSKQSLLGIPQQTLSRFGAVSKEIAQLMSENIKQIAKTDLGLGVTGIAGPKGATQGKPIGLVYIALATQGKKQCQQFYFHGAREIVRQCAAQAALDMVRRHILKL